MNDREIREVTYEDLVLEISELPPLAAKTFNNAMTPLRGIWTIALKRPLRELGVRERDARQTRRTYATMGLQAEMNPGYLSRQMGHKNAKMFFEVCSKWIDGAAKPARERQDAAACRPASPNGAFGAF
ncbi:hypothetical protein ACFWP0_11170 [Achromobacter sp. NPDC058515]|uniref:hypothetical protein n=1 Tax=Achromobacter sp. NPDC058515 TaxID=3346533 RepID=UPI003659B948